MNKMKLNQIYNWIKKSGGFRTDSIAIVTSFFDIGRGDWRQWERSTQYYLECFYRLAKIDNDMVIFTSAEIAPQIATARSLSLGTTRIVTYDWERSFVDLRAKIQDIQMRQAYIDLINPDVRHSPEYWNADYVLVNYLKTYFVNEAIRRFNLSSQIAWIDFGYCRDDQCLGEHRRWTYQFPRNKISVFALNEDYHNCEIREVIRNNMVFITGGSIVGGAKAWRQMGIIINKCFNSLTKEGLIDDDQTLLLMAAKLNPEFFHIFKVSEWFGVFKNFNDGAITSSSSLGIG